MPTDELSIDFMMLADRAEAINGKLYVMGGAWDQTWVQSTAPPITVKLSIALAVLVPWNQTNQDHTLTITLEDPDGNPVSFRVDAQFTAGRPPNLSPGTTQRLLLALPDIQIPLPGFGDYAVTAHLNQQIAKKAPFKVSQIAPPFIPQAQGAQQG